MNQTVGMARLYYLGEYRNIKVEETITDIPEELINNLEFQSLLRALQIIRLEKSHISYRKLAKRVNSITHEEALALLDNLEKDTIQTLEDIFKNGNGELEEKEPQLEENTEV